MGPVNETMRAIAEPLVRKAALVQSFNEAWLLIGALFMLSLFVLPWMRRIPRSPMGPASDDASA
jgi:DHA2 family multidrug resistance protein